jgi:ADP-ribosylation factor GTPase-activating protein 2
MQVGGNANANAFFQQHECFSKDAQVKYNSKTAQLYKEKLSQHVAAAMRQYGTNLNSSFTAAQSPESATASASAQGSVDFWSGHEIQKSQLSSSNQHNVDDLLTDSEYKIPAELANSKGPQVVSSSNESKQDYKSVLITKKGGKKSVSVI